MHALAAHAQASVDHAGLPFHPACPHCLELRALGAVRHPPLFPRRLTTGAVALALVGSGGFPAAALAQAPPVAGDDGGDSEGTADPDSHGDLVAPDADLGGGGSTQTLEASPELPDGAPEPDVLDAPDGVDEPPQPDPAAPPPDPPTPQSPASPQSPAATPQPDRGATEVQGPPDERSHKFRPLSARKLGHGPSDPGSAPKPLRPLQQTTLRPSPVAAPGAPKASGTTAPTSSSPAPASAGHAAGTHVVRPGETLWGIAAARLGGTGGSPGRIAAEVTRLWEANQARIGTGNPDMLRIGTVLRLS
jgi:nucleoid-associated protein YgaU